jgi:hypothetical protein
VLQASSWRIREWSVAVLVAAAAGSWLFLGGSQGHGIDNARASQEASPVAGEETRLFKQEGARWIREQRERHHPHGAPLGRRERRLFSGYFPLRLLDAARVRVVERFENPAFFRIFEQANEAYPIDLREASGLALIDTILIARRANQPRSRDGLLFHELVHLVQYDVLGLEDYMELYVDSWLEGGRRYREILHEQQAYELAARFRRSDVRRFSVEAEVRARFGVAAGVPSD